VVLRVRFARSRTFKNTTNQTDWQHEQPTEAPSDGGIHAVELLGTTTQVANLWLYRRKRCFKPCDMGEMVLDVNVLLVIHREGVRKFEFLGGEPRLHLPGSCRRTDREVTRLKETQLQFQHLHTKIVIGRDPGIVRRRVDVLTSSRARRRNFWTIGRTHCCKAYALVGFIITLVVMQQVREIVESRGLLWNLTVRELKQRYRGSFLGWAWSMLNPLSQMLILTFVFGVAFGITAPVGDPSGIDTYGLYVLSGIIPWGFFSMMCGLGLQSITVNGSLVRKVAFPRETLVLAQVLFSFVQCSIEMVVLGIALAVMGSPLYAYVPVTLLLMVTLMGFGAGIALILSVWAVYFRDLGYLWNIFSQVWFYATPVIYDPHRFDGQVSDTALFFLHWNPPSVYLRALRHTVYDGRFPGTGDIVYCVVAAVFSVLVGLRVFKAFSRRIAEEL